MPTLPGALLFLLALLTLGAPALCDFAASRAVVPLEIAAPEDSSGSIIAADVDDDGRIDLLVSAPGYVGAYATDGTRLWSKRIDVCVGGQSESQGLPGHHGPGLQAGDVDGDGRTEVLFLDRQSTLHTLRGSDGTEKWSVRLAPPEGAEKWELAIIANFRGVGDRDLLLQATNAKGYRMGRYLAAHALETLAGGEDKPLWRRDDFVSCAHNGARIADLDADGKDEVLGATILGPDGSLLVKLDVVGHVDSVFVADVRPDLPGLEVVMLEEGRLNRVFLVGLAGLIWETHHRNQEPQNAAIGRFIPGRSDVQVWCRSRYNEHQTPFVFDAFGKLHSEYKMDDVAPQGWTLSGVEVIHGIHWTGEDREYACAKERHESGDVCIFDPVGGKFVLALPEKADRLYVADVTGDWREEIIVWAGNELHIYANPQPNPNPDAPRLWELPHYRRSKMTWNYYSP